jgi:hypothetical protein
MYYETRSDLIFAFKKESHLLLLSYFGGKCKVINKAIVICSLHEARLAV